MIQLFLKIRSRLKGDLAIWAIAVLLAFGSFMVVYSASTNLVYVVGNGTVIGILIKHAFLVLFGFGIMFVTHKIPYAKYTKYSRWAYLAVFILLLMVMIKGLSSSGTNTARWIQIPFIGIGFQPSSFASLVLMILTARYLSKHIHQKFDFYHSLSNLWFPVGLYLFLIVFGNFSTAAFIFLTVVGLMYMGGYPKKYLLQIFGIALIGIVLIIIFAKITGISNRVDTWKSRIESFTSDDNQEAYQVENAKIAIATGGFTGRGPGKSVQKNFLPQSSSDFIFAIIVEEYGTIGAIVVILLYCLLLFRIYVVAKKATTIFGTLLVLGCGVPIILQALINLSVATNMGPVTGQPLPIVSSGGTAVWVTCAALGIILSVSRDSETTDIEIEKEDLITS